MKNLIIIALVAFSFTTYAQEQKPVFEKEGDTVKATYFHANGEISQQGYFVNQKLDGQWKMFNEKGDKIAMGNYQNGVKTGTWVFWDGDTRTEVDFNNNQIAGVVNAKKKKAVVSNN